MSKLKHGVGIIEPPLKVIDYILFIMLAAGCFFTFQNSDLVHTAASSYGYLNGHILDFYDYNGLFRLYDSYLPSTYIVFALWNLPLYLCGFRNLPQTDSITFPLLMWNKLLPCMLYIVCGRLVYRIAEEIGMGKGKSKLCAYAFLTMPIGFFSQFIFGQYDVFTLFFVLLGFWFWLKDKDRLFILSFAVAITFKYFAFVIFIPLLLLKQKNIFKAVLEIAASVVPALLEAAIYVSNDVFREYVFGFSATEYVYSAGIATGMSSVSIVVLVCGIVAAYAWFKNVSLREERIKWALYLIGFMLFAIFGLSMWHPQWLLLMVPFLTLGAFIHNDTKIFIILELLLTVFFVLFTVNAFADVADEILLCRGIFAPYVENGLKSKITMSDILIYKDTNMCLSFFTAILLIMAAFKHPKDCLHDFKTAPADGTMGWIRTRFLAGLAVFLVPAAICFYLTIRPPFITFYAQEQYSDIGGMVAEREVTQVFIAKRGVLDSIEIKIGTYDRENDVKLSVSLRDATTGELLFNRICPMREVKDNSWLYIDTEKLRLEAGGTYRLDILSLDADGDSCVTLYRTSDIGTQTNGYAIIGGEAQDYHLCVRIAERNPK